MRPYHKIQNVYNRDPETKRLRADLGFQDPVFEYLKDTQWLWTEKVDGTNIHITVEQGRLRIGGRTDRAQLPCPLLEAIGELIDIDKWVAAFGENPEVVLYGEGYGPKIQNGGKYRDTPSFVLFDIRIGDWWLQRCDVVELAASLGMSAVPARGTGTIEQAVNFARPGFLSSWGDFEAEGLVIRPLIELTGRNGNRIIAKVKTHDYRIT